MIAPARSANRTLPPNSMNPLLKMPVPPIEPHACRWPERGGAAGGLARRLACALLLMTWCAGVGEMAAAALADRLWDAHWIVHPTEAESGYGVFRFRKVFALSEKPQRFIVQVSADRRYRLLVNGVSVAVGPQRGDAFRWHYETVDIAPQLHAGKNVLAATVWNYGADHPWALNSVRTALIVQGAGATEQAVNTDDGWRVRREAAYATLPVDYSALQTFIVVGPGDRVDGRQFEWRWAEPDFDDTAWATALPLGRGTPERIGTDLSWWLAPRTIPPPFEREQRFAAIRRHAGAEPPADFLQGHRAWAIPPHTTARVLLDHATVEYQRVARRHGR